MTKDCGQDEANVDFIEGWQVGGANLPQDMIKRILVISGIFLWLYLYLNQISEL